MALLCVGASGESKAGVLWRIPALPLHTRISVTYSAGSSHVRASRAEKAARLRKRSVWRDKPGEEEEELKQEEAHFMA